MEKWKKINQFPNYMISSYGRIKNKDGKILKSQKHKQGYLYVSLCREGLVKRFSVHRLVAITFHKNPENKKCVNHKDGIKDNNKANNLEWCTHSENTTHAIRVTKKMKSPSWKGKFGKNHNRSKGFQLKMINGDIINYGSGLEAYRQGYDHTSISWALNNCDLPYVFSRGKLKGIILLK